MEYIDEIKILDEFNIKDGPLKVKIWLENSNFKYYIINNGKKITKSTKHLETVKYILSHYIYHIKIPYECFIKLCIYEYKEEVESFGTRTEILNYSFKGFDCHLFDIYSTENTQKERLCREIINLFGSAYYVEIINNIYVTDVKNLQCLRINYEIYFNEIECEYNYNDFIDIYNLWNVKEIMIYNYNTCAYAPTETYESMKILIKSFKTYINELGCDLYIDYKDCITEEDVIKKYEKYIDKINKLTKNKDVKMPIFGHKTESNYPRKFWHNRKINLYTSINSSRKLFTLQEICSNIIDKILYKSKLKKHYVCKIWNKVKILPLDIRKQIY